MTKKLVPPPKVIHKHTALLACKLTDEELRERGRRLAATLADMKAEESRADMLKTQMKSAMSALESRRDMLALEVSRGEEIRDVEVEQTAHWDTETVISMRTDTGEVLGERKMEPGEKQYKLEAPEPAGLEA